LSVYVPPSATQDEHDALEIVGAGAAGEATVNVTPEECVPSNALTTELHVPAVPVGGMIW
jgi:hypothetical protein